MRAWPTVLAAAVVAACPCLSFAQTGQPSLATAVPAQLIVEQAVATALETRPSLRAARAAIAAAEGRRVQAGLRPNPTVSAGWREEIGGMDRMTELSVALPLDLFRRGARAAAADAGVAVAEAEARRAILEVEIDVRSRYGAVMEAQRSLAIGRALEEAAREMHALLARRVEEGASPALERDLARVEWERASATAALAAAQVAAALVDLRRSIGIAQPASAESGETLEDYLARPEVAELARNAPQASIEVLPQVGAAEARVRAREAAIDQARSEGRWDLTLSAGYLRMRSGFPFRAFDGAGELRRIDATFHNASVGAMVMVPLFNRNQGAVAAAAADRDAAHAEAADIRLTADTARERAGIELRAALDVVRRYRSLVVPQASKNLDTVRQGYELGRGTLLDVLQTRQQLLMIQSEYTAALRRAYDAHVAGIATLGGLTR